MVVRVVGFYNYNIGRGKTDGVSLILSEVRLSTFGIADHPFAAESRGIMREEEWRFSSGG